jgi:hypothetical protein
LVEAIENGAKCFENLILAKRRLSVLGKFVSGGPSSIDRNLISNFENAEFASPGKSGRGKSKKKLQRALWYRPNADSKRPAVQRS